jgi:hypothetical protein
LQELSNGLSQDRLGGWVGIVELRVQGRRSYRSTDTRDDDWVFESIRELRESRDCANSSKAHTKSKERKYGRVSLKHEGLKLLGNFEKQKQY